MWQCDQVTEFSVLGDHTDWQNDFERRLRASHTAAGIGVAAAERMLEGVRGGIGDWTVAEITDAGVRVGYVAVVVADEKGAPTGRIGDLHIDALHMRPGTRTGRPGLGRGMVRGARRRPASTYGSPSPPVGCSTITTSAGSSGHGV